MILYCHTNSREYHFAVKLVRACVYSSLIIFTLLNHLGFSKFTGGFIILREHGASDVGKKAQHLQPFALVYWLQGSSKQARCYAPQSCRESTQTLCSEFHVLVATDKLIWGLFVCSVAPARSLYPNLDKAAQTELGTNLWFLCRTLLLTL